MQDVDNLGALRTTLGDAAESSLRDLVQWKDTVAGVIEITERSDVH